MMDAAGAFAPVSSPVTETGARIDACLRMPSGIRSFPSAETLSRG